MTLQRVPTWWVVLNESGRPLHILDEMDVADAEVAATNVEGAKALLRVFPVTGDVPKLLSNLGAQAAGPSSPGLVRIFESGEKVRVKKDGRVGTIKQRYGGDNAVNTSSPTTAVETYLVHFGNEITPGESLTAEELEAAN